MSKGQNEASGGAICGDGMCPYIPCKKFPKCLHWKEELKEIRRKKKELGMIKEER